MLNGQLIGGSVRAANVAPAYFINTRRHFDQLREHVAE